MTAASVEQYVERIRDYDDEALAAEAYDLAAGHTCPQGLLLGYPQALSPYQQMILVAGEQARRRAEPDSVDPGPQEWTVPA
ncbi:MAG TPA: hypothetical protein VMB51_05160 [Solirubrobacteraceae bacterium]|nr:hypothetical protein [Solirubrobacteraceae bacterium]